jgi:F-type H+-transporting ATPase subunit epsilon
MKNSLTVVVVTPEQTVLETEAEFVALPLYDGEVGILPGRAPLIGRLGPGEMRLKQAGTTTSYYVDGGFVQIVENVVSIMTSRAMLASRINVAAAEQQLATETKKAAPTAEEQAIRERHIAQARAQIHTARKAGVR